MALKVALTGICGVFAGLIILCVLLILIQKIIILVSESSLFNKTESPEEEVSQAKGKYSEISGEVIATLAASIYLDSRSFDEKKKLLTIQKVTKPYAPWVNSGKTMLIADNNYINSRKR